MTTPSRAAVVVLLAASLSACTRTHARTPENPPGLATPDPPDRVIIPVTIEAVEPPPEPAPPPSAPLRPAPSRPERPASSTPAPTPAATSEPAAPPPVLQTTSNPGELEQKARGLLAQAQRDLDRVPVQQLTANARAQYDTAKGLIRQANDLLQIKNVALAKELADKAASLASQLARY